MKQIDLKLDFLDWRIIFFVTDKKDKNVNEIGIQYNMLEEDITYINDKLDRKCFNGGVTLSHTNRRLTLVFIYLTTSKSEQVGILSHETRHVVDRICEHNSIEDIETPAYIMGYLMREVYKKL